MVCVYCGGKLRTTNSRATHQQLVVWRRRRCQSCRAIFTTEENTLLNLSIRVRHPGGLQPFSKVKLQKSLQKSLTHRIGALEEAEALLETCIQRLLPCANGILEVDQIITTVNSILKNFDMASAIHYRAHHNDV